MKVKPFRILHVVGGMDRGGAETMIMNLYRKVDRTKIQFDFLYMKPGQHHYDQEIRDLGGRILYINPPRKVGVIRHIYEIVSTIRKYGPFIAVHAHTLFHSGIVMCAAFLAGVGKRICHSHNTSDVGADKLLRKMYFNIMKTMIKIFATHMIACGRDAGAYLFGKRAVESGEVVVFPNAIDLKKYEILTYDDALRLRQSLGLPEEATIIGHVGRFAEQKNHKFFIPLMEYVKVNSLNICLVLVGDGELRSSIQKLVEEKGLNKYIKFLGIREDIPELMNMFDVFVMPSLYEGLPVTLIEAQAAGTPCIISDNITREVDMGLNLVEFVSLDSPVETWIDKIIEKAGKRCRDFDKIREVYKERKYDVEETAKDIMEIYLRN